MLPPGFCRCRFGLACWVIQEVFSIRLLGILDSGRAVSLGLWLMAYGLELKGGGFS